jgi:hypothetical protein
LTGQWFSENLLQSTVFLHGVDRLRNGVGKLLQFGSLLEGIKHIFDEDRRRQVVLNIAFELEVSDSLRTGVALNNERRNATGSQLLQVLLIGSGIVKGQLGVAKQL